MPSLKLRAAVLSLIMLFVFAGSWEVLATPPVVKPAPSSADSALVAGASGARVPRPSELAVFAFEQLRDPFYDRGSNDKGIGIQLAHSLGRVLLGYGLA
ncbi:MAG TPA: hypothetical protein VIW29_03320, partial [Polyangiaceae bacterium]